MEIPTHYFVYVGHSTLTKNKLQESFFNYLFSFKYTLVISSDIAKLKKQIISKAMELNEQHKRCKPLKVHFERGYKNDGYMLCGFEFLTFYLYEAELKTF